MAAFLIGILLLSAGALLRDRLVIAVGTLELMLGPILYAVRSRMLDLYELVYSLVGMTTSEDSSHCVE